MTRLIPIFLICVFSIAAPAETKKAKKNDPAQKSELDRYIEEAHRRAAAAQPESPGSLWSSSAALSELSADLRAHRVDDVVTVLVNEQASAVATGTTKTSRASSASSAITAAAGQLSPSGRLANLLNTNTQTALNGTGTTSRQTTLSTNLTARVVDVLPNGNLVIEGSKTVLVNSETQVVTLRGVVRPVDLSTANTVISDAVAEMELKINGKGVVNDAVHRPFFLYRLLMGLLPF